jgi:O-antigen/teichoic acid export membrane protein
MTVDERRFTLDDDHADLLAGRQPLDASSPFWKTRTWWGRAGRTAVAVYASTALAFVGTVVVARGLGPQVFGEVVLAVAVATLIATMLDLTLEEAVVHHGYRALVGRDTDGLLGLFRASLLVDLSIGTVVAACIVTFAGPLADLASAGRLDPGLVRLAALVTLPSAVDSTTSAILQVAGRPDLRGWMMAWANLVRLPAIVLAVQVGSAEAIIVAYAASSVVGSLTQGLVAWRIVRRRWSPREHAPRLRVRVAELVRFGFHTSLTTSVYAANGALIPVVLGRVAGPATVGVFRVAMFPLSLAATASAPIRLVLYPEQARLAAEGDHAQIRHAIRTHMLAAVAIAVPCAAVAWLVLPWLVPLLYSDKFESAIAPARILLIAAVLQLSVSWFKTLPAALGKPQLRSALATLELVLMIVLLVALGDEGPKGAAIAYSATAVVSFAAAIVGVHVVMRRLEASTSAGERAVTPEPVELGR